MLTDTQLRTYRAWRQMVPFARATATAALLAAREGRVVRTRPNTSGDSGFNGKTPVRSWWHEDQVPFRRVGYADEVISLGHEGWYVDDDRMMETLRGLVYLLPHGRYLAGYDNSDTGAIVLYCDQTYDDEKDAARAADGHAEWVAQMEREHNAAWQAGQDASYKLTEALDELRDDVRRMVRIALYPDSADLLEQDDASADRNHAELRDEVATALHRARDSRPSSKDLQSSWDEGFDRPHMPALGRKIEL